MPSNSTNTSIFIRIALAIGVTVGAAACSTDETVYDDDPVDGTADVELDDVGVEDDAEGGLDLDNGNVPGSQNDQDLDPYDEQLDLNTEENVVE